MCVCVLRQSVESSLFATFREKASISQFPHVVLSSERSSDRMPCIVLYLSLGPCLPFIDDKF